PLQLCDFLAARASQQKQSVDRAKWLRQFVAGVPKTNDLIVIEHALAGLLLGWRGHANGGRGVNDVTRGQPAKKNADRCQGAIGHDGALLSDALHQIDDIAAFDVMDAAFAPCGQDVAAEDALGVYPGCRPCTALAVLLQVLLRAGLYGIAVALGCFGLSG